MATEYIVCETLPYYSPRTTTSAAAFRPHDTFDTLTRSMCELTRYADLLSRALADPKYQDAINKQSAASTQQSDAQPSSSAQPVHVLLRPAIDWKETAEGFVLTASTPGLRKDELKVELVEASGAWYLEVGGETAASSEPPKADNQSAQPQDPTKLPLDVRPRYRSFSEKVRLPAGVDREAMRATYEDGLLVVTMPRAKAKVVQRQKIAIN